MIKKHGIHLKLNHKVTVDELKQAGFDEVVVATGVEPRVPSVPGVESDKVLTYQEVLDKELQLGKNVAVMGAGGIGFDISEYLTHEGESTTLNKDAWMKEWGVDISNSTRGGLMKPEIHGSPRKVVMMQRKQSSQGKGLNKTTGWVHRAMMKMKGVEQISGVSYDKIDEQGLHITITKGEESTQRVIEADNIVLCTGQVSVNELYESLKDDESKTFNLNLVGGAEFAGELDAKRAIKLASELAAGL